MALPQQALQMLGAEGEFVARKDVAFFRITGFPGLTRERNGLFSTWEWNVLQVPSSILFDQYWADV